MRNTIILSMAWALLAPAALAQGYGIGGEKESRANPDRMYSVDVQPLPLLGTAALGGYRTGALAAIGAEMAVSDRIGAFVNLGGASLRLTDAQTNSAQQKNSDPIPRKVDAAGLSLGSRFYKTSATTDSWFTSVDLTIARDTNQWVYGDQKVDEALTVLTPAAELGYRWVWDSGFLIRAGVGIDAPVYLARNYNQVAMLDLMPLPAATETEDRVRRIENRGAVGPVVDLALGWAF